MGPAEFHQVDVFHVNLPCYTYNLIDTARETRIFELEPGNQGDLIDGRLINMDLCPQTGYEAISYVWRHKERNVPIKCDGSVLYTTLSTAQALSRVRSPHGCRRLWIDSICINQDDLVERAHQVRNMGSIFGQADRVLIWLDKQEEYASAAFWLIDDIHAASGPAHELPEYPQPPYGSFGSVDDHFRARFDGPDGQCLAQLLSHEWFTRVWVLQEVGLGRNVSLLCGTQEVAWEKVIFTHHFLRAKSLISWRSPLRTCSRRIAIMTSQFWKESCLDFLAILDRTRRCDATDPRDKVFALLSHPNASDVPVDIDYYKPLVLVYRDLAKALLNGPSGLRLLSTVVHDGLSSSSLRKHSLLPDGKQDGSPDLQHGPPPSNRTSLPSWVPDWRLDRMNTFDQDDRYNAGGDSQAAFEILHDDTILRVRGLLFDTVEYGSQPLLYHEFLSTHAESATEADCRHFVVDTWSKISNEAAYYDVYPGSKDPSWLAYCKTLTADHYYWFQRGQNHPLVPSASFGAWRDVVSRLYERGGISSLVPEQINSGLVPSTNVDRVSQLFLEEVIVACQHRRVFVTSKGYYGIAPSNLQLGDSVCVLFGGRVPFLLRPSGDSFELVGECYVHGIMNGEVIEMWKAGSLESAEFSIL